MPIKLNGSTSGYAQISAPATASNNNVTLPNENAVLNIQGPSFSAYCSISQSISSSVYTKISFQTSEWDTNSNFSTSTYRFTPTVAGYYYFNSAVTIGATLQGYLQIYKNGSSARLGGGGGSSSQAFGASALLSANGSTDYFEIYLLIVGTSSTQPGTASTYFQSNFVRSL